MEGMARIEAKTRPHKGQNAAIHSAIQSTYRPIEAIAMSFPSFGQTIERIHLAIGSNDASSARITIAKSAFIRSFEVIA